MSNDENKKTIVPDRRTWMRSAVAAIPWAGGALDHLLFDKADEIRIKNIESSIDILHHKIQQIGLSLIHI